jgi:hypothetical protein
MVVKTFSCEPGSHCRLAGVTPTWIKLAELGIRGNSHNMMQEKNSDAIAEVIHQWLAKTLPAVR